MEKTGTELEHKFKSIGVIRGVIGCMCSVKGIEIWVMAAVVVMVWVMWR